MIDSVYKTCQSILNKQNFGYFTPSDFNLWAKQAQLEIFQDYFAAYNKQINLENVRRSGTEYANLSQKIAEDIETFSVTNFLGHDTDNIFILPSLATTGDVAYLIGKILAYTTELYSGTVTTTGSAFVRDTTASFSSSVVKPGDLVFNVTLGTSTTVVSVSSATQINTAANIFQFIGEEYLIISARSSREAEKVSHSKITMLNSSLLTTPSNTFPAYTSEAQNIKLFPDTINIEGMVEAQYYRYPLDPKWTYVTITGGSPSFDQSQPDYQDFEIGQDAEVELIIKICQYAGVSIREPEVVNFMKREQMENDQPKGQ